MAGIRIKYYEDDAGEHRFRISGMNGEPMAGGEGYKELADAIHAVKVIGDAFKSGDYVIDEGQLPNQVALDDEIESGDEAFVEFINEDEDER